MIVPILRKIHETVGCTQTYVSKAGAHFIFKDSVPSAAWEALMFVQDLGLGNTVKGQSLR